MTLIGVSLDEAREYLISQGYTIEVISNTSDKCKEHDSTLVTNAVFEGQKCKLTVSDFLLHVGK